MKLIGFGLVFSGYVKHFGLAAVFAVTQHLHADDSDGVEAETLVHGNWARLHWCRTAHEAFQLIFQSLPSHGQDH